MKFLFYILMFSPIYLIGQCLTGDCENGWGIYKFENAVYEGQWKNNMFHGDGSLRWSDGAFYSGSFKFNLRDGQGVFTFNGDKYEGEYKENEKSGEGTYTYNNGNIYVGQWKSNKLDGEGSFTWANGDKYVGEYKDDLRHGRGTMTYFNRDIYTLSGIGDLFAQIPEYSNIDTLTYKKYEGGFENNRFNGEGVLTFEEGITWIGYFAKNDFSMGCVSGDCKNGFGYWIALWTDLYVGEFKDGERHGKGTYTWGPLSEENFDTEYKHLARLGSQYVGDWEKNREHGVGVHTYNDGSMYEGEYQNASRHGKGIFVSAEKDYEGIGVSLSSNIDSDYVVITKVYKGFPAEKAGLIEGDKIIELHGESAIGKTTQELISIIKGTVNTEINILIERNGKNITFRFNREKVKLPSYTYTGEYKDGKWDGTGIYIDHFGEKRQGLFEDNKFISGECWDQDGNEIECP